jgi:hypothetical protein
VPDAQLLKGEINEKNSRERIHDSQRGGRTIKKKGNKKLKSANQSYRNEK